MSETPLERWERQAKAKGFVEPSINTKALQIYDVFHLFIPEYGDETNVQVYSHSQGDWEILKHKRGQIWTLPTSLFSDYNFIWNHEGWENWTPEDWWQYATGVGCLPKTLGEPELEPIEHKPEPADEGIKPGTRYIKWKDFTSLHSYPLIERAVTYPHDYKRKCYPYTKDGYVSVDAIYNMSAWASWKSSSLGEADRKIAEAINALNLYHLMKLNEGRRMNKPALFPVGLLPLR
jgi:hypothetical protein